MLQFLEGESHTRVRCFYLGLRFGFAADDFLALKRRRGNKVIHRFSLGKKKNDTVDYFTFAES